MVDGLWERGTNAHAHGFDAIAIKVEARQRFAERFAHTVVAVGPHGSGRVKAIRLLVKADDVIGAGEQDALDAFDARAFVEVVGAPNIGVENGFKRTVSRHAAQVNDGINAIEQGEHAVMVAEIAARQFFIGSGTAQLRDIRNANDIGHIGHARTEHFPESARRASE